MHQTVKDFISAPGFMHRVLGPETNDVSENGHSFLAKYRIAKAVDRSQNWDDSAQNALLGIQHAQLSEVTTGTSQRKFLDSLADTAIEQGFRRFLEVNSHLSLAVVVDLRLYIREKLGAFNVVNDNPSISLLYCLTSCASKRCSPGDSAMPGEMLVNPNNVP